MKESFIRWQKITIQQLSYLINLIIALSFSILGFSISLLMNPQFTPIGWSKLFFTSSFFLFVLATVSGIICSMIRLADYRITKNIARKREAGVSDSELIYDRIKTRCLDT
jgi:uncharacterized membrane protein YcjF (UPF0283 family)